MRDVDFEVGLRGAEGEGDVAEVGFESRGVDDDVGVVVLGGRPGLLLPVEEVDGEGPVAGEGAEGGVPAEVGGAWVCDHLRVDGYAEGVERVEQGGAFVIDEARGAEELGLEVAVAGAGAAAAGVVEDVAVDFEAELRGDGVEA